LQQLSNKHFDDVMIDRVQNGATDNELKGQPQQSK
jgi:hypothetical protein